MGTSYTLLTARTVDYRHKAAPPAYISGTMLPHPCILISLLTVIARVLVPVPSHVDEKGAGNKDERCDG